MTQPPTDRRRSNPLDVASLVTAALLLLASIAGRHLFPLIPLFTHELGISYG